MFTMFINRIINNQHNFIVKMILYKIYLVFKNWREINKNKVQLLS